MPTTDSLPSLPNAFVRIPTKLLGQILGYERPTNSDVHVVTFGHARANAIHALAIKLAMPGHVLNKHNLRKRYGIGWRRFAEGVRLLKDCGILERWQAGRRTYAEERLVAALGGAPFVALDKALLSERSALVAFVAAVNLSPAPQSPADVARRLGITSPATIRALVRDARAGGHVACQETAGGKILVARRGNPFGDTISDDPAKMVPPKTLAPKMVSHNKMEDSNKMIESKKISYPTRAPFAGGGAKMDDYGNHQEPNPDRVILSTWRSAPYFREMGFVFDGKVEQVMPLGTWRAVLDYYGGAPAQVATTAAHRQALEIAHELSARSDDAITPGAAMMGIAAAVCDAHERGKPIRSLGFIADGLARRVTHQEDDAWAYDLPCRIDRAAYEETVVMAEKWFDALEAYDYGIRFHRRELLATYRVEELYGLLRKYGPHDVVCAINYALDNKVGQGKTIISWVWFEQFIGAVKAVAARPPVQRKPPQYVTEAPRPK